MNENNGQTFEKVNGVRLFYQYYPNPMTEHTVLLLHGFLSSSFSFRRLAPYLKQDYSVLMVDWPPFGQSEKPRKFVYSYSNISETIIALVKKLGIERIVCTGHSMGAQLTLHICKAAPELVDKAVLICASGYLPRTKSHLIAASYMPFTPYFTRRWLEKTGVAGNLRNVVFDTSLINQDMIDGYALPFENKEIFYGLVRFMRQRESDLMSEEIKKIKVPSLVICGEHDRIVPIWVGKRLTDDLPESRLKVLEAGHLLPEEKPADTARLMKEFIGGS